MEPLGSKMLLRLPLQKLILKMASLCPAKWDRCGALLKRARQLADLLAGKVARAIDNAGGVGTRLAGRELFKFIVLV